MLLSNAKKLLVLAWAVFILTACGGASSPKTDTASSDSSAVTAATMAEAEVVSWVRCAMEYQTCTFSGTAQVRYGLNGTYVYKTATGSIGCNNTAFGNDPVYGATKVCDYLPSTTLPPDSWTYCASEYQTCAFSGTAQVRYGLNGVYVYKTATGSIGCNNETFGSDPAYGRTKVCEYLPSSSPPPTPTAPSAVADSYSVQSGQTLSIAAPGMLANDAPGSGGGTLTVAGSSVATHGTVAVNPNGSFTYVPVSGYVGSDSFTYTIRDGSGQQSTATVSLTVTGAPPSGTWTYCSMEYQMCTFSGTAQVRYGLNGVYVYKTATGSIGCNNETFGSDPAYGKTKMCEYQPVTPPVVPEAGADSYSVQSGQILTVAAPGVLANDTPGSGTSVTVVSSTQAAHGTATVNTNGGLTYVPAAGYVGQDSFTYTIRNNLGQEHSAIVRLTVTATGSSAIGSHLDLANATIAKYHDDKQAAASYTFDDGNASSPAIAAVFESFGTRATFYINPGIMPLDWSVWRTLAQKGHEVGNHTMNHRKLIDQYQHTDETLELEINQAQLAIELNVGVRPLTFAFPYNEYSARSLAVVMQNHIATRLPGFESDPGFRRLNVMSSSSAASSNEHLSSVLNLGGWFCLAGHGMDGDGWEPVTTQYLQDHLRYATSQADRLWIDTFVNVARYRLCREQAQPQITVVSDQVASVKVGGSYSASLCTKPLTVAVPVLSPAPVQAKTPTGADVPVSQANGKLLVNLVPGSEILLQIQ